MQQEIRQLVPAENWRVVCAGIQDANYSKVRFQEVPLVAWGLTADGRVVPLVYRNEKVVDALAGGVAAWSEPGCEVVALRVVSPLDSLDTYLFGLEVRATLASAKVAA